MSFSVVFKLCLLFFDAHGNENPSSEVIKVTKAKSIALDDFDEIVGDFELGIGVWHLQGVDNLVPIFDKGPKDSLKNRMDRGESLLYQSKEFIGSFLLKVKKQKLVEVIAAG